MRREPLNRERVLEAAVAFADEHGIHSLSMRKLGQQLGVEGMALYNHVANKDELLDGMVDLITRRFELPNGGQDWKGALRRSAISAHAVLLAHDWACTLSISRGTVGPARLGYAESVLGCFRDAGFSVQLAHHALHAYNSHIFGFTLQEMSRFTLDELGPHVAAISQGQLAQEYPRITETILGSVHDDEYEFALVLDLILDGLDRLRDGE